MIIANIINAIWTNNYAAKKVHLSVYNDLVNGEILSSGGTI